MIREKLYRFLEVVFGLSFLRSILACLYRLYLSADRSKILELASPDHGQILIVINANEVYRFDHIKPLVDALRSDSSYRVILIGSNPRKMASSKYQRFLLKNGFTVNKDIVSYIWLPLLKPDLFLEMAITPYHMLCHRKTITILFAHGLSSLGFSKNHVHIKNTVTYDYILSTGPYQEKALRLAAQKYQVRLPPILHGGFIRGDLLSAMDSSCDSIALKRKCGLEPKTTILFAPTWGEFSSTVEWIDPVIKLCDELDFNVMIKLHPLMFSGKTDWETAGVDWRARLDQLRDRENIHICDQLTLEEYMLASDVLVTDASSVGMEYMFLKKPVIFLPALRYFEVLGKDKPIYWVREGLEVQTLEELKERLSATCSDPTPIQGYPLQNISYRSGKSVEGISALLISLVGRRKEEHC